MLAPHFGGAQGGHEMALITREPKGIVFTDLELQHAQDGERLVERNKKPALEGIAVGAG